MRRRFLVGALGLPIAMTGGADRIVAGSGIVHDIEIKSFAFNPSVLEVRPGDQIRWVNRDISPHTATAEDGSWDTGELRRAKRNIGRGTEHVHRLFLRFSSQYAGKSHHSIREPAGAASRGAAPVGRSIETR